MIAAYSGYGNNIVLEKGDGLAVHHDKEHGVVTLEYQVHGKAVKTGAPYDNRFVSIVTIKDRKIVRWRDYMASLGKCRSILSGIFTYTLGKGHFAGRSELDNPASHATLPETVCEIKKKAATPSFEETKKILACLLKAGLTLERGRLGPHQEANPDTAQPLAHFGNHLKTEQSERFVAVTKELRAILLDLSEAQGSPIRGPILVRENGDRVNLDNASKRSVRPTLAKAGIQWHGFYSLRHFHGTVVSQKAESDETASRAMGNSKDVARKYYIQPTAVRGDVRRAVNQATAGLTA